MTVSAYDPSYEKEIKAVINTKDENALTRIIFSNPWKIKKLIDGVYQPYADTSSATRLPPSTLQG